MLVLGYLIDFRFDFRKQQPVEPQGRRQFLRGCGPFEMGSGDAAVMLLHGIAGSPAQLREMAGKLADAGYHIYGVVLPGHGTDPEELYGITWQKWYAHVLAEYQRIREKHGSVSIVGFSLGAALGMRLAMEHQVDKLVCMSIPSDKLFHDFLPAHHLLKVASVFSSTARTFPKRLPDSPDGPEYMIYRKIPLDALHTLVDLAHDNISRLSEVRTPTLVIHSAKDVASKPRGAQDLYNRLGTQQKRIVWLTKAPHGVMHGSEDDKAILHSEIVSFLS
jgi:carboxylesterase